MGAETISVVTEGADVPGFSASLTAPTQLMVTDPSLGGSMTIDSGSDFEVSWTGTSVGVVELGLRYDKQAQQQYRWARCRFESSAGQGAIPSQVLANFAGYSPTATLSVTQYVVEEQSLPSGGWSVTTELLTRALQPDGSAAENGGVTLY